MSFAIPGQIIGSLSTHTPGPGTFVSSSSIHASLAGHINLSSSKKPTISISTTPILPSTNSTILGRVIRVQQRQLTVSILAINPDSQLYASNTDDETQFQAILRKEDVRAFEKDKVVMNESFRVGDIVKAVIIGLGDERSYYISTAGNDFGVVVARSEAGNPLVPASWKEMKDVKTGKGEMRKVAKPS